MKLRTLNSRCQWLIWTLVVSFAAAAASEATVEELKNRVTNANVPDRAPLCIQISEKQLEAASQFYVAGDDEKAQASLVDVVAFSGLARDYAIQSRKHEKQSEIAIRKMSRKLAALKHNVTHDEQKEIQDSVDHLEQIRDDLLSAMFSKGDKK